MEILLGNLREGFKRNQKGQRQAEEKEVQKADGRAVNGEKTGEKSGKASLKQDRLEFFLVVLGVTATLALAFLFSRVTLFYFMYPSGIALLTVLLAKGKGYIYILPMVLLGILSTGGTSYPILGDMISAGICGGLFFFMHKSRLGLLPRALIASAIVLLVKAVCGAQMHILYLYDGIMLGAEAVLVIVFTYLYAVLFSLFFKDEVGAKSVTQNIASLVFAFLLGVCGLMPALIGQIAPLYVASMLITLLFGYKMGPTEGALAGLMSGILLMGLSGSTPSLSGIFACGGLCAGLLRREQRWLSALCFAAVCQCFGVLRGYPDLYMSVYEPMLAAMIFVLLPKGLMDKCDALLAKAGKEEIRYELLEKRRMKALLLRYHETFSYLARAYGKNRGETPVLRTAENSRAVMGYQFKGMAKAVGSMMEEIDHPKKRIPVRNSRYQINVGISGYAKADGVSGDSYLCTDFTEGQYMIVLSDGMGKGKKAAEESTLTVNSLHHLMKAGFDVELALRIINSVLLVKSTEEIYSTVDLALLNLYTGRLKLFKIGAAATFIKRGPLVEIIKVSALPIGIIDEIPIDCIEVGLRKGDQVIVVSDGITEADRATVDIGWLQQAISAIKSTDSQTVADLIINKAVERCGLRERDDMTVIVATLQ